MTPHNIVPIILIAAAVACASCAVIAVTDSDEPADPTTVTVEYYVAGPFWNTHFQSQWALLQLDLANVPHGAKLRYCIDGEWSEPLPLRVSFPFDERYVHETDIVHESAESIKGMTFEITHPLFNFVYEEADGPLNV